MNRLPPVYLISLILFLFGLASPTAIAQEPNQPRSAFEEAKWQRGPAVVSLGSVAEIRLPKGYMFAGAADTKRLMEAMQNPTSGLECGFVAPDDLNWFAVYLYEETGYVRDDEKNS